MGIFQSQVLTIFYNLTIARFSSTLTSVRSSVQAAGELIPYATVTLSPQMQMKILKAFKFLLSYNIFYANYTPPPPKSQVYQCFFINNRFLSYVMF